MLKGIAKHLIITAILTAGLAPGSVAVAQDGGAWSERSEMPIGRKEIANATVYLDGKIYVIGGIERTGEISDVLRIYDVGQDAWSTGHPLPVPVWRAFAAAEGGKIYLFGGYRSTQGFPFNPTNRVFEYDPAADQWTEKAPMARARGTAVAVAANGRIHVLGGVGTDDLDRNDVYDPVSDTWTAETSMPTGRSGLTAAVIDQTIYVAGGYRLQNGVVPQSAFEAYDLQTQAWTSLADLPMARLGISSAVVGGKMFVFGGAASANVPSRTLAYDPATDGWEELADMPEPGSFMGAAAVGDSIFVIGGGPVNLNRFDGVAMNRVYSPSLPTPVESVELPETRAHLNGNFPNPFDVRTSIQFELQDAGPVSLTLHDVLGRKVAVILEENRIAGRHEVDLDAAELRLTTGTYFFRLATDRGFDVASIQYVR